MPDPQPPGFDPKRHGCGALIVLVGAVVGLGLLMSANNRVGTGTPIPPGTLADATAKATPAIQPTKPIDTTQLTDWTYSSSPNPMHDRKIKTACVTSVNSASLHFPYHDTTADLCFRTGFHSALDAYVSLNADGQILCGFENCTVRVRFDQATPVRFSMATPSDHSSNVLFFTAPAALMRRVRAASRVIVELELYQDGDQALEFHSHGLRWPPHDD